MKIFLTLIIIAVLVYAGVKFFGGRDNKSKNQEIYKTNADTSQQLSNEAMKQLNANTNINTSPQNSNMNSDSNTDATIPAANTNSEPQVNSNINSPIPESESQPTVSTEGGSASGANNRQSATISLDSPLAGSSVTSPFMITGKAKAQSGTPLTILITDKSNKTLITETVNVKNVDSTSWGTFKITIAYEFSNTREGNLVVFDSIDPEERVSVPLTFN